MKSHEIAEETGIETGNTEIGTETGNETEGAEEIEIEKKESGQDRQNLLLGEIDHHHQPQPQNLESARQTGINHQIWEE